MRVPYLLACWLVLGCLLVSDEVRDLFLYEYTVGAERIGAALDCLLGSYDDLEPHTPSVLRRRLLALALRRKLGLETVSSGSEIFVSSAHYHPMGC